jgi:hypothetical protein
MEYAVYASEIWHTKVKYLVLEKHLGKKHTVKEVNI